MQKSEDWGIRAPLKLGFNSCCAEGLIEFEYTKGVIRISKSKDRQHKGQKDKQRSTKHTHKTKDRVTPTPLRIGCELRSSGRVSSSNSTSGIHRVYLVTDQMISHE
jgi:hypothetical protein